MPRVATISLLGFIAGLMSPELHRLLSWLLRQDRGPPNVCECRERGDPGASSSPRSIALVDPDERGTAGEWSNSLRVAGSGRGWVSRAGMRARTPSAEQG